MAEPSYEDEQLACTDTELIIKRYYFPAGAKHVAYDTIKNVKRIDLSGLNALRRWRLWGSGDFIHWWNLDMKRPRKSVALELDIGQRVKPTITPDRPDAVQQIIEQHR